MDCCCLSVIFLPKSDADGFRSAPAPRGSNLLEAIGILWSELFLKDDLAPAVRAAEASSYRVLALFKPPDCVCRPFSDPVALGFILVFGRSPSFPNAPVVFCFEVEGCFDSGLFEPSGVENVPVPGAGFFLDFLTRAYFASTCFFSCFCMVCNMFFILN